MWIFNSDNDIGSPKPILRHILLNFEETYEIFGAGEGYFCFVFLFLKITLVETLSMNFKG